MRNKDRESRPKVVLVTRALVKNDKAQILVLKRSNERSYLPGRWELPGGKLDIGQDASSALEREVREETGLVVIPTDRMAYWHGEIISSGKYKGLPYIILVGTAKTIAGEVTISNEHTAYKWVSKAQALELDLTSECRAAISVLTKNLKND